jgi:hypothetical protein
MHEINELLREIRDLVRVTGATTGQVIVGAAQSPEERVSAIAAAALLNDGIGLLREAFSSLDIPRLPYDVLADKDDDELATYASRASVGGAIALRDQIGGISLEEAQSAILILARQRINLALTAFEACNRLAPAADEPSVTASA